jgi:RNA polymerase sigma-32 factor
MATTLATGLPSPTTDLQGYLRAVYNFPLLSADEEHDLALRLRRDDDPDAAWGLVTSHLRFVAKIARGYGGYGLAQEDLIQEGNIGLMKAVKGFDPSFGVRLASYAVHWIRAEIHEFVLRNWRIVRVATTKAQRKLFFNLRRATKRLSWLSSDEAESVAEDLKVRAEDVFEMEKRLYSHDAAFDGAADDDGEQVFAPAAIIEDRRYDPAATVEASEWQEFTSKRMAAALETLDERSRDIVTRRWLSEPNAKLRELAAQYGVSMERIRQIEAEAFKRMRDTVEGAG